MKVLVQGVMQNGNRRVGYEWTAPECFCAVAVFVNEIKTWQQVQHILTYEWSGQTQFKNNRIRSSCNSLEQKKVWCLHWGDIRKLCSSPMCSPASNCQEKKYIRSFNNKKKKKKINRSFWQPFLLVSFLLCTREVTQAPCWMSLLARAPAVNSQLSWREDAAR